MNLKRFTGRTTRDAMQKVKAAFGHEAIVLSTKPCPEGVEIIAMAAEGNGLRGMRERVQAHGGRLQTGPGERGGFGISVWMPLQGDGA